MKWGGSHLSLLHRSLLFTDPNATIIIIFTDIIIHAKVFSVKVMSVRITTDKVLIVP